MNKRSLVLGLFVFTELDVSTKSLYLGRFILDELRKTIFSSLQVKKSLGVWQVTEVELLYEIKLRL